MSSLPASTPSGTASSTTPTSSSSAAAPARHLAALAPASNPAPGARPPPRDMQGLLQWSASLAASDAAAAAAAAPAPMDPARRAFLAEAFAALTVDEIKLMKDSVARLREPAQSEADVAAQETALDELQSLVENLDTASDLHKIGGYVVLVDCLGRPQPSIRARAADAIATCVQSHPPMQEVGLATGTMPALLAHLGDSDPLVRKKVLYAVSALARDYVPAQTVFVEAGGLVVLRSAMLDDTPQVRTKAVFLLRNLCITDPSIKDAVREAELLPVLVVLAADDDTALREQALATLVLLTEDNASNAEFCRRTDVGLRRTLEAARRRLESEPAEDTVDERDSIAQLWAACFA